MFLLQFANGYANAAALVIAVAYCVFTGMRVRYFLPGVMRSAGVAYAAVIFIAVTPNPLKSVRGILGVVVYCAVGVIRAIMEKKKRRLAKAVAS